MSIVPSTYIVYANGASCNSQNIASAIWVIFSSKNKFVGSGGVFSGPTTNNLAKYEAVIKLLSESSTLGIHHLVVRLDSQLVVSHLNTQYSIHNPILFHKYLRVRILQKTFDIISYEHISREFNTLANLSSNYVLDWHLSHS